MRNLYEYLGYRPYLKDKAKWLKEQRSGWTLGWAAARARIQAPYLTNALNEKAHLSLDQVFALAPTFELEQEELQYLSLLSDWERSGHAERKRALSEKLESLRKEKLQSKSHLKKEIVNSTFVDEFTRFYLNPHLSLLNGFLGIEKFARDPRRIAGCLGVKVKQVESWLKELVQLKFAEKSGTGYVKLKKNFHLPKDSPLCAPHMNLMQQVANRHLQSLPEEEKYNFTVLLSADEATRELIQREFLEFLKKLEPLVKAAPAEELYGMRFDLFKWSSGAGSGGGAAE